MKILFGNPVLFHLIHDPMIPIPKQPNIPQKQTLHLRPILAKSHLSNRAHRALTHPLALTVLNLFQVLECALRFVVVEREPVVCCLRRVGEWGGGGKPFCDEWVVAARNNGGFIGGAVGCKDDMFVCVGVVEDGEEGLVGGRVESELGAHGYGG